MSSSCLPSPSTAAMRILVPPRSTPMENWFELLVMRQTDNCNRQQGWLSTLGLQRSPVNIFGVLLLALWTVVGSPAAKNDALNRCLADSARQARPQIDVVLKLKEAFLAIGVHIIRH